VYETLFEMHRLGVLTAAIPEFGKLDCLIAHDPFHVYTVDQHSLIGVRELERLRTREFAKTHPLLTEVMHEVARPELLFLGMIFHDVGKGHGHDHSGRGARMMRDIGVRLGLNEDERAACEFLVQQHLYMSHLAQRRDLADDNLIADFCRTVGSVDNLQRLYLLTYADMRAVGPGVYNNWRDSLLTELYVRAKEFFELGRVTPEDRAARAARIQARVVKKARPEARPALRRFFEAMPDGYFVSTPEEMLASHGTLRQDLEAREEAGEMPALATLRTHFSERDFTEFAVCTRDRPGLFSRLSGVLAANGMNILAARIATSNDGVALDAFRISNGGIADHDDGRWERVEDARDVLAGKVDIGSWAPLAAAVDPVAEAAGDADDDRHRQPSFARPRCSTCPRATASAAVHDHELPLPPLARDPPREDHDDGRPGARRLLRDRQRGTEDRGRGASGDHPARAAARARAGVAGAGPGAGAGRGRVGTRCRGGVGWRWSWTGPWTRSSTTRRPSAASPERPSRHTRATWPRSRASR
jgi:hypothetical protein